MKKKASLIALRPKGSPLVLHWVRPWMIICGVLLVCCGFIGYTIPFSQMRLDIVNQNQKTNLARQNNELVARTRLIREELLVLKKQADELDEKKKKILALTQYAEKVKAVNRKKRNPAKSLEAQLSRIENSYHVLNNMFVTCQSTPDYFSKIPVAWPLQKSPQFGLKYGLNKDPFTGETRYHAGVDFIGPKENSVYATASGTVVSAENHPLWGIRITLQHSFGFSTVYAHLNKSYVQQGRMVTRGDVIGSLGQSGLSSGPHLHYEIWLKGKSVDPLIYLYPRLFTAQVAASESATLTPLN